MHPIPTTRHEPAEARRDAVVLAETVRAFARVPVPMIPGEIGLFARALSGKVRPAPREPEITHYGCSCCEWYA